MIPTAGLIYPTSFCGRCGEIWCAVRMDELQVNGRHKEKSPVITKGRIFVQKKKGLLLFRSDYVLFELPPLRTPVGSGLLWHPGILATAPVLRVSERRRMRALRAVKSRLYTGDIKKLLSCLINTAAVVFVLFIIYKASWLLFRNKLWIQQRLATA